MRIIKFQTDDDRKSFDIMLMALYADKREHNRSMLKKIGKLQEQFEELTVELKEQDDERGYPKGALVLAALPSELVLEEEPFDLLRAAMDSIGWKAQSAKLVNKAYDLIDAAEHVTAKELKDRNTPKLVTDSEPTADAPATE